MDRGLRLAIRILTRMVTVTYSRVNIPPAAD